MLEGFLVGIIDASLLRKAMQSCSGVDTRGGSLVFRGARARPALGPAARDLVLLSNARLVGKPDFYGGGLDALFMPDLRQALRETFLKSSIAPAACA